MQMQLAINGGLPIRAKKVQALFHANPMTMQRAEELLRGGLLSDFYGGPICAQFEEAFAAKFEVPFAVAVNSGTAALHCAVAAAKVGPGDEVLVPTACFFTAASVVIQQRAVPVLVDSVPDSLEIDLECAGQLVTPRTKAIIVAHMYGYPGRLDEMRHFADRHDLALIEDVCQAHGARYMDSLAGTVGDLGCFSFAAPRKHINTGEGGMVITHDEQTARIARQISNKGKENGWYTHQIMGYSYCLPEICALCGLQGLDELEEEVARRRSAAEEYDAILSGSGLELESLAEGVYHSYFRKIVRLPEEFAGLRDWIVRAIEAENVSAKPPHAALHTIPWLRDHNPFGYGEKVSGNVVRGSFPRADNQLTRIIDLETGPGLTAEDARVSANAVAKVWGWVQSNREQATRFAADAGEYGT